MYGIHRFWTIYTKLTFQLLKFFLCKRILGRIQHSLRLVEIQIFYWYANVLEYFVQSLAEVSECYGTVVREVLLDQYVTIETSHFGDSENTDTTEGSGSYRKYFTLCNICAQLVVCGRLQTIEEVGGQAVLGRQ